MSNILERLSAMESDLRSMKWAIGLGVAVLVAVLSFSFARMGSIEERIGGLESAVGALPAAINQNLMELNRTLADSITATRAVAQQPQVIVIERLQDGGQAQRTVPAIDQR